MAVPKMMDRVCIKGDAGTLLVLSVSEEWQRLHAIEVHGHPVLGTLRFEVLSEEDAETGVGDADPVAGRVTPVGWVLHKRPDRISLR